MDMGNKYNADGSERKFAKDIVCVNGAKAEFCAEKYPGSELLDTYVELNIDRFAITWKDRENLMRDLEKVLNHYKI